MGMAARRLVYDFITAEVPEAGQECNISSMATASTRAALVIVMLLLEVTVLRHQDRFEHPIRN